MEDAEKKGDQDDQAKDEHGQAADETISDSKKCPECGEPIENVRASCPNCAYEYKDSDYDQPDAGSDFIAGTEMDDSGNEIVDEAGKVESERNEDD